VYTKNGDRNLEAEMWKENYLLGGESGGNIILNDGDHAAADAVYVALVLSQVLVQNRPATLGDLVAPLHRHPQAKHSIDLQGNTLTDVQKTSIEHLRRQKERELGQGSRVLLWASTTKPGVVRIQVEGTLESTQDQVNEAASLLYERLRHPVV
jgi:phosphomannomutase